MQKFSISWRAPEYEYQHKGLNWYWVTIIVTIILLGISIWQKNFLFALFIVVAEVVLIFTANRIPPVWEFEISEQGVRIGEKKNYAYSHIEGFDIHPDTDEFNKLVLKLRARLRPYLIIRIPDTDSEEIEKRLEQILVRDSYEEPLSDVLSKILKL